jgi:hypothetical protein
MGLFDEAHIWGKTSLRFSNSYRSNDHDRSSHIASSRSSSFEEEVENLACVAQAPPRSTLSIV